MAAFAGDFDDFPEDEAPSKPLPPEDRLWRHPSELGSFGLALPLDPITIRRRWLASQPTRASAWTAGLVGAILATGLVALGTHLASAFTGPVGTRTGTPTASTVEVTSAASTASPALAAISSALATHVAAVGRSIVELDVVRNRTELHCLAVGVRADGYLLAPAADVVGATTLLVTLPDGSSYVGRVVASDATTRAATSGLALIHINGIINLSVASFATDRPTNADGLALAVTAPGGSEVALGTTTGPADGVLAGQSVLVDAVGTDLEASAAPSGSLLLDAEGHVAGIVTGERDGWAVYTPAWIADAVSEQLVTTGGVVHGWLGIEGASVASPPGGVRVLEVVAGGAAARAGLRDGDTIVSVRGHDVTGMAELQSLLYFIAPGTRVDVGVVRDGHPVLLDTVLGRD